MRDALSIINRIQHDPSFNPDEFLIGFEDRFTGTQFVNFTSFIKLNMPSHRVRYIMQNNVVLWSRLKKIDILGQQPSSLNQFSAINSFTAGSLTRIFKPTSHSRQNFSVVLPNFDTTSSSITIIRASVGLSHTLVLTKQSDCYSFGLNQFHQVSPSSFQSHSFKQQPVHFISSKVLSVSAGSHYSMLVTSDHNVYGFGRNDYGQIGILEKSMLTSVDELLFESVGPLGPVVVRNLTIVEYFNSKNILKIACGETHSLALSIFGSVYTFGNNYHHACGHHDPNSITPRELSLPEPAIDISVGRYHSLILLSSGSVLSFGSNASNQLGRSHLLNDYRPLPIDGNDVLVFGKSSSGGCGVVAKRVAPVILSCLSNLNICKIFAGIGGATAAVDTNGLAYVIGGEFGPKLRSYNDDFYVSVALSLSVSYLISSSFVDLTDCNLGLSMIEDDRKTLIKDLSDTDMTCRGKILNFYCACDNQFVDRVDFVLFLNCFPDLVTEIKLMIKGKRSENNHISKIEKKSSEIDIYWNFKSCQIFDLIQFLYGHEVQPPLPSLNSPLLFTAISPSFDGSQFSTPDAWDINMLIHRDVSIRAHRVILSIFSSFFRAMFTSSMADSKESQSN
ncbi:hypothetical protein GEMRC1_003807 [Eukaryota sp. GEM-RC1]